MYVCMALELYAHCIGLPFYLSLDYLDETIDLGCHTRIEAICDGKNIEVAITVTSLWRLMSRQTQPIRLLRSLRSYIYRGRSLFE